MGWAGAGVGNAGGRRHATHEQSLSARTLATCRARPRWRQGARWCPPPAQVDSFVEGTELSAEAVLCAASRELGSSRWGFRALTFWRVNVRSQCTVRVLVLHHSMASV